MSHTSPNWKKPSDIMRKRLVKKRTSSGRIPLHNNGHNITQGKAENNAKIPPVSKKRQNPFACGSQEKKVKKENDDVQVNPEQNVFSVLDKTQEDSRSNDNSYVEKITELQKQIVRRNSEAIILQKGVENATTDKNKQSQKVTIAENQPAVTNETTSYNYFPIDWSLKNKIRYISPVSFSWCSPLKSNEESKGIASFVQNIPQNMEHLEGNHGVKAKVEFKKCCMVWMHPHIPWLKLFPRILSDNKIGKPSAIFHSQEVQKSMINDWTESLSSAFHLLRSGQCEFFYLCSHQFTALFRGTAMLGVADGVHALLTPTSRGFRESVKKEGVEFSMPLNKYDKLVEDVDEDIACVPPENNQVQQECTEQTKEDTENADDEEDISNTNEGASSWLETLGIDKNKYRSLNPNKVMLQRDTYKIIDNRPESAILVEGANTMALVNFLLNSRSCVPNTGELAGVPATILAPVAFKGATLKSHQVKQGSIRQQLSNGTIQEGYSVEISGPLFPTNIINLTQLFTITQKEFSLTCSIQEASTPFNLVCPIKWKEQETIEKMQESYKCGKGAVAVPINDTNNGRQAIREMSFENDSYTWT